MSSSLWERFWNGDEDVTALFQSGAAANCDRRNGSHENEKAQPRGGLRQATVTGMNP